MATDKQVAWEALRAESAARFGPDSIFGEGPLNARFVLIGEAPGENEVNAKRPFVGRAGQLLDRLLRDAQITRADTYITNVVKVRPTADAGGGRVKNRPPRIPEINAGLELLLREIALIGPRALILFGNVPAKALIGKDFAMGANRGQWFVTRGGIPALATYHPAYILRLEGPPYDETRALVVNDLIAARDADEATLAAQPLS